MSTAELVLATGISLLAPILWAALGELITELSGVINVGIEGVMVLGAFASVWVFQRTNSAPLAVTAAVVTGLGCAAVLGLLCIGLGAHQIVTGIMFSTTALGLTAALAEQVFATGSVRVASLASISVPGLSAIPWIGQVLFRQNLLVYAAFVTLCCLWYLLYRTWFGLHLRAAGQRPLTVETAGLSVRGLRLVALTIGCVLIAVGGATLVLSTTSTFQPGITNGRGYIALAVVVLGRWHPARAVLGALVFGLAQALQFQANRLPLLAHLPSSILLMAPYLVAVVVLLFTSGSRYPAAVGTPYRPLMEQHSRRIWLRRALPDARSRNAST